MGSFNYFKHQKRQVGSPAATIIPIASGKGGVGKTLVSANLAIALAELGHRVIAADLDFGGANLHSLLGLPNRFPGVGELFKLHLGRPLTTGERLTIHPTGILVKTPRPLIKLKKFLNFSALQTRATLFQAEPDCSDLVQA